jgi:integrase
MVFKAARRDGAVTEDPTEFVSTVRQKEEGNKRPFTIPELQAVLAVASKKWKSMILFAFYTGQRLSDVALLLWSNVDFDRGEIRLRSEKMERPIAESLRLYLAKSPRDVPSEAPVHPIARENVIRTGKSAALSGQFGEYLADTGLRPKTDHKSTGKGRSTQLV